MAEEENMEKQASGECLCVSSQSEQPLGLQHLNYIPLNTTSTELQPHCLHKAKGIPSVAVPGTAYVPGGGTVLAALYFLVQ